MNPAMLPAIASLLGQQGMSAPMEMEEEVTIENNRLPPLKRGDGLVRKGFFSRGQTGGDILGTLGDAFLIQAGRDPIYRQRVMQDREAEALENFTTDPLTAIQQYNMVNPRGAADLWMKQQENVRDQSITDARIREAQDKYDAITHDRATALLGAATPTTYPAMRKRYYDYYTARGVNPMLELPEAYDEEAIRSLLRSGVSPEDQIRLDDTRAYREGQLENTRRGQNMTDARGRRGQDLSNARGYASIAAANARAAASRAQRGGWKERMDYAEHLRRTRPARPGTGTGYKFVNGQLIGPDGKPVK